MAVRVLAGAEPISALAARHGVSRPLVYRQMHKASAALDDLFSPKQTNNQNKALFSLQITKRWLEQVTLALTMIAHASMRGVMEFMNDYMNVPHLRRFFVCSDMDGMGCSFIHGLVPFAKRFGQSRPGAGCIYTYGLFVAQPCLAPMDFARRLLHISTALGVLRLRRFCRRRSDLFAIEPNHLCNRWRVILLLQYSSSTGHTGGSYSLPRASNTQIVRAILFASATTATFVPRLVCTSSIHRESPSLCLTAC
jgi:hypothetical protein